ncbi:hypothetical protein SynBOUM118_00718 [Synechococcus sp. BOUM118]|nr:hypothetical protein SynBOUM118_00718 [Synechococcus sp. BOUM118]
MGGSFFLFYAQLGSGANASRRLPLGGWRNRKVVGQLNNR